MTKSIQEIREELTLVLLYLNRFSERLPGYMEEAVLRSWKGYCFDNLNHLEELGLIHQTHRSKSITFTQEGLERARELLAELGIED